MQIKQIEENFTISEQIKLEDLKILAKMGTKILICNRPEGEEPNQLTNAEIITEAETHGIKFVHIPSPGREIPQESLTLFVKTFKESNDKIHAYCRTGTRSSIFWGLTKALEKDPKTVINEGHAVNVNLEAIESQLEDVYAKSNP